MMLLCQCRRAAYAVAASQQDKHCSLSCFALQTIIYSAYRKLERVGRPVVRAITMCMPAAGGTGGRHLRKVWVKGNRNATTRGCIHQRT